MGGIAFKPIGSGPQPGEAGVEGDIGAPDQSGRAQDGALPTRRVGRCGFSRDGSLPSCRFRARPVGISRTRPGVARPGLWGGWAAHATEFVKGRLCLASGTSAQGKGKAFAGEPRIGWNPGGAWTKGPGARKMKMSMRPATHSLRGDGSMTTGRRQRVFCGACGREVPPGSLAKAPSARSSVAWPEESAHPSLWRCERCVEAGLGGPDSSFEGASWPATQSAFMRPARVHEDAQAPGSRGREVSPKPVAEGDGATPHAIARAVGPASRPIRP